MVLKHLIQHLINKYLKNYIEKLDFEKVKLNLKNGHILLENLHLKPEALAYLNIPVVVAVGYLEQLKVTIPWNSHSTNPTEVHINGLYMLIVPKNEMAQDMTEHYAEKSKRIQQKLNNLRKATLDSGTIDNNEMAVIERMRFQVMKNLILTVRNLHICYEMQSATKLGHPFSFGFTLHYLEVTSANNIKPAKGIKGNTFLVYKIKEINSFAIYWNSKCKSRIGMPFNDVLNDLKSKIAVNNFTGNSSEMKYILQPVNLNTESIITLKPKEHYYERSTLIFNIQVPQMYLNVDSEQISDVLDFIKFQNYTTIYDRCREYRELLLEESMDPGSLTNEQKQRIQFLESKLDIFHLAYIRHKVEMDNKRLSAVTQSNDINQDQQPKTDQSSTSTPIQHTDADNSHNRWNPWSKVKHNLANLTKSHKKPATTHVLNERIQMFEDLPKIDAEINFHKVDLNILPPATNARLNPNGINGDIIASISINDARVYTKRMCITSRVECTIEIQTVRVFGIQRDKQYRPILLIPMTSSSSSPLVYANFELFPLNQESDYCLNLIIEPIQFVYDAPTITQLVECFEANGALTWQPEPEIARQEINDMEQHLSNEKIFDMTINLKGGSFRLPEHGVYQKDFAMIHIDFGNLMLKSGLDNSDKDESLFKTKTNEQRFYAKYKLELSDLRIFYSYSNNKRLNILRRIPLIDIDFYKCFYLNDTSLINWRIGAKIAMGDTHLSKMILSTLIRHLQSVPLFYSNMAAMIKRINHYFTLFSPSTTLIANLLIYHCCLRFLMYPQTSIRADFHIYLTKTRDENSTDTNTMIALNQLTMMEHIFSEKRQFSRSFYQNEQIKLAYSSLDTQF